MTEQLTICALLCDKPITGDDDLAPAAIPKNGPVHLGCLMTDEQLLALLDEPQEPCTNCTAACPDYMKCTAAPNSLVLLDGFNNATISRTAGVFRHAGRPVRITDEGLIPPGDPRYSNYDRGDA